MPRRAGSTRLLAWAVALPAFGIALMGVLGLHGVALPTWMLPSSKIAERAYAELLSGRPEGGKRALELFDLAVKQDPASAYRWCDLGEARLATGDREGARRAMDRAAHLGPKIPPVLLRNANFGFSTGDPERILSYSRRIMALTPAYNDVIFDLYAKAEMPVDDALRAGISGREAGQAYLRRTLGRGSGDEARLVWEWALSHGYSDDRLAADYAGFLIRNKEYEAAANAWRLQAGGRERGYPEENAIFNGGFERELAASPFDWALATQRGVRVSRSQRFTAEGAWSVEIAFLGTHNVALATPSVRVWLEGGSWRLTARVRTQAITTREGVGLRLADEDTGRELAGTERLVGTNDWKTLTADFQLAAPRLAKLSAVRSASWKFDNQIAGKAWIDSVRVSRR